MGDPPSQQDHWAARTGEPASDRSLRSRSEGGEVRRPCAKLRRALVTLFTTGVVVLPFYVFIDELSAVKPSILRPCNDGCTFIRYWGTKDLPNTAPKHVRDKQHKRDNDTSPWPVWLTLKNGEEAMNTSVVDSWYCKFPLFLSRRLLEPGEALKSLFDHDKKDVASRRFVTPYCEGHADERDRCEDIRLKRNVSNHLSRANSPTLRMYMTSVKVWGALRLLHEWIIVTEACQETTSLAVGYLSAFPQIAAVAAGFIWSIGAAEVFINPQTEEDGEERCACYYELNALPMFALMATPVMLYMATREKVWKLGYATLHGDYLYSVSYDVPYRTASHVNTDPLFGFISGGGEAASGTPSAHGRPRRGDLRVSDYRFFHHFFLAVQVWWNLSSFFCVYAVAIPTLSVRFYTVVVVDKLRKGTWCEKVGTNVFGLFFIVAPILVWIKQWNRFWHWWEFISREWKSRRWHCRPRDGELQGDRVRVSCRCAIDAIAHLWMPIEIVALSIFAVLALRWIPLLVRQAPLDASNAGIVSAGGFYLFVSVLCSLLPSDTHLDDVRCAIGVKAGVVPPDGLQGILTRSEKKHFGLGKQRKSACDYMKKKSGLTIESHGIGAPAAEYEEWRRFLAQMDGDDDAPSWCEELWTKRVSASSDASSASCSSEKECDSGSDCMSSTSAT